MKRLILFELLLLFLSTTFMTDGTPGWVQQTLPVNKFVRDIFFIDSLKGWAVTTGGSSSTDTAYIFNTTNGGTNWLIQKTGIEQLDGVQFLDNNNGYAVGKLFSSVFLSIYKTTNSGINWQSLNNISGIGPTDLYFVNKDTGWVCASEASTGGLYKTTNGGVNWTQQLSGSIRTNKIFFLNKDTGWVASDETAGKLYRTINGGNVWTLQYTFSSAIGDVSFLNSSFGLVTSGTNQRTTDGGFSWTPSQTTSTGLKLKIVSDSVAFAGLNFIYVVKTTNGGRSWFNQLTNLNNPSVSAIDSNVAWAGGSGIVHTTDGGGPPVGVISISSEIPSSFKLFQNYPNPFNPVTNIKYQIVNSKYIKITVYNIQGKQISELVNQKQSAGTYETDFDGSNLPSGVYFYQLIVSDEQFAEVYKETKRMILVK